MPLFFVVILSDIDTVTDRLKGILIGNYFKSLTRNCKTLEISIKNLHLSHNLGAHLQA